MSFKEPGKMVIIASEINAHVFIEILDNFLVPSIENWFCDEVIYKDITEQRRLKLFSGKEYKMILPANSLDLNLGGHFLKWSLRSLFLLRKIYELLLEKIGTTLINIVLVKSMSEKLRLS